MKKTSEIKDILVSCLLIVFCLWGIMNVLNTGSPINSGLTRDSVSDELAVEIHEGKSGGAAAQRLSDTQSSNQKKPIMIFVTSWCGACRALERSMKNSGLTFKKADIEKSDEARRHYALITGSSAGPVPLVLVGKRVVLGNQSDLIEKLAREN